MRTGKKHDTLQMMLRLGGAIFAIAAATLICRKLVPGNPTTVGFVYLVTILLIATEWGLREALVASLLGTLCFNFFFFAPIGTFTIADPQNWVALFSFSITALIASHLSGTAKRRTLEVKNRQLELERLYSLSRAILLMDTSQSAGAQIVKDIIRIYELQAVAVHDRGRRQAHIEGDVDIPNLTRLLEESTARGIPFRDDPTKIVVTPLTLGNRVIGSLALKGDPFSDAVLQALSNLVAIGLEKARAHEASVRADAARQSEEFKSTLLDALAHEFKTPLTSIRGSITALLASGIVDPNDQRELFGIVDQEATKLHGLVNEALHLARVEAGRIQLNKQPYSIPELIDTTVRQMETALEGRTLELSFDPKLPAVVIDAELIQIALRQLIDNAVKYSPPGTPIAIAARISGETIVVGIRNEGAGIPERERSRIFERFYRGSDGARAATGTGMGLPIAREILLAHGGDIQVESTPGHGAEFFFSLPLAKKDALA